MASASVAEDDQNRLGGVGEAASKTGGDAVAAGTASVVDGANIPLFDASKMGFNDRAWNDPPPLLINSAVATSGTGGNAPRPKLTSRVAFPLNFAQHMAATPPITSLNPNAPPPMTGFVKTLPPEEDKPKPETDKTE